MSRPDVYSITSPISTQNPTAYHERFEPIYKFFDKVGATEITLHHSTWSAVRVSDCWFARCDDRALSMLALGGYEIGKNETKSAYEQVTKKFQKAFDSIDFSGFELREVDIMKVAADVLAQKMKQIAGENN